MIIQQVILYHFERISVLQKNFTVVLYIVETKGVLTNNDQFVWVSNVLFEKEREKYESTTYDKNSVIPFGACVLPVPCPY